MKALNLSSSSSSSLSVAGITGLHHQGQRQCSLTMWDPMFFRCLGGGEHPPFPRPPFLHSPLPGSGKPVSLGDNEPTPEWRTNGHLQWGRQVGVFHRYVLGHQCSTGTEREQESLARFSCQALFGWYSCEKPFDPGSMHPAIQDCCERFPFKMVGTNQNEMQSMSRLASVSPHLDSWFWKQSE